MSWSQVAANIVFAANAFSGVEQAEILGSLENLYSGSAMARAALDGATNGKVLSFDVASAGELAYYFRSTNTVSLNLSDIASFEYFNKVGVWVKEIPALTYIHEVIHAGLGLGDVPDGANLNTSNIDQRGATLGAQEDVAVQMGWVNNIQISYRAGTISSDPRSGMVADNKSYTDGEVIDIARIAPLAGSNDLLDHSNNTVNTRDLMLGLGGDDIIKSGAGSDFLYGGEGNDTLDAGDQDDHLFGEEGSDSLLGGQGNDVLVGGAAKGLSVSEADGDDTLRGGDGADLLTDEIGSNELHGDAGADKFVIKESTNTLVGGQGADLIDLSKVSSGDGPVIQIDGGSGHDWIEGLNDASKLRVEASGVSVDDIQFVIDRLEQVLIYYDGSPDPGEEDPQQWEYLVDVYLKVGSATIYVGRGFWWEQEGWDGQIEDKVLEMLQADVTFNGTLLDEQWLAFRQHQVDEGGFQSAMKDGQKAHYEERGEATSGADSLAGGAGDDQLHGAGGADQLSGGDGVDTLDGGSGDDELSGGAGGDILRGGGGADVALFDGNVGDYAFSRDAAGALIAEHLQSGDIAHLFDIETLRFASGGDVSATSLAPLYGTLGRDDIQGTELGQTLRGFGGADTLTGFGAGNTLDGGAGADTVVYAGARQDYVFSRQPDGSVNAVHPGSAGTDRLVDIEYIAFNGDPADRVRLAAFVGDYGTSADDYVQGTNGADILYGLAGDDFIQAGGGNDTLVGGQGADALDGGSGADVFVFDTLEAGDVIASFETGADLIDLTAFDADMMAAGDQPFAWIGSGAFTNVAGQLRFTNSGGGSVLEGDTNGDGVPDIVIVVEGVGSLQAADFLI